MVHRIRAKLRMDLPGESLLGGFFGLRFAALAAAADVLLRPAPVRLRAEEPFLPAAELRPRVDLFAVVEVCPAVAVP